MERRAMCNICNKKSRHNQRGECINCVTNKSKVIESDTTSV